MDRNLFLKLKTALEEIAAEKEKESTFKNKGTIFSRSGFKMSTRSALSYLDNLYKLENIFKNNGNKEALQDVEKEIQLIDTQLKNKKLPVKDQYVHFLDRTKVSYNPTLLPTLKKALQLATNEVYSREDLYRNLTKEDLKEANKDLEKELGVGNFCYSPEIDLNAEDFLFQYDNTKDKKVFLQDLYSLLEIANEKNNVEEIKNIQDKINLILNNQLKRDIKTTSKVSLKQKNKKEPDLIVNKGFVYENLEEDIEKHDTLNPLLFDENDELKPEIKEAIEKIVNQFVEDLKTDGVKIEVKDIILVGSNVSYNYTKDSDLDIHIIVDKDKSDCDPELYTLLYGAYRSLFNKNYDITIKGIPVEIYVELY